MDLFRAPEITSEAPQYDRKNGERTVIVADGSPRGGIGGEERNILPKEPAMAEMDFSFSTTPSGYPPRAPVCTDETPKEKLMHHLFFSFLNPKVQLSRVAGAVPPAPDGMKRQFVFYFLNQDSIKRKTVVLRMKIGNLCTWASAYLL